MTYSLTKINHVIFLLFSDLSCNFFYNFFFQIHLNNKYMDFVKFSIYLLVNQKFLTVVFNIIWSITHNNLKSVLHPLFWFVLRFVQNKNKNCFCYNNCFTLGYKLINFIYTIAILNIFFIFYRVYWSSNLLEASSST